MEHESARAHKVFERVVLGLAPILAVPALFINPTSWPSWVFVGIAAYVVLLLIVAIRMSRRQRRNDGSKDVSLGGHRRKRRAGVSHVRSWRLLQDFTSELIFAAVGLIGLAVFIVVLGS